MKDDNLLDTLAKLRADYAAQLPATVAQLEALWRRILAEGLQASPLNELVRTAHSVAGSAATFGIPRASETGRELELFLEQLEPDGQPPGKAEQEKISALLVALKQAAAQN